MSHERSDPLAPPDRPERRPQDELRAQIAGLVEQWRAACVLKRRDEALLRTLPTNERLADLIHEQERTFARCANELEMLALPVAVPARAHQEETKRIFQAGWDAGFQEALLPDDHPEQDRMTVAFDAWQHENKDELARSGTREIRDRQPAAVTDAGEQ